MGLLLLILGRQVFWVFVGGVGFITAMDLVSRWAATWPDWVALVIALVAGLIGALLAVFLQEVAIGIAGFLGGGYATLGLLGIIGAQLPALTWILALVGGIIGVIFAIALFDWALIILSSLTGASLIAQSLPLNQPMTVLVFIIALSVGIVVQAGMMHRQMPHQAQASHAYSSD